ncbi:amidohydrolase [Camelliibacillus cellulosilyticus]|uniref:Amidohydrolase n=1 Tax=Camelliibacillus cellulosilyticus TaxID=2174486 RepID=A0ABV9GJ07_9BACL
MTDIVDKRIDGVLTNVVEWRRHLHRHPELSFQEVHTAQFIYDTLLSFGNIDLSRPTKTSVVGRIKGGQPGKVLAIRADIDALPIKEKNNFSFKSENDGIMHACGHDGHAAMLLGAAQVLSEHRDLLHGEVRLIFQHAEELFPGGAQELVDLGVLDDVDWVIGAHLWSPLESGKIGIIYGPMMAAPDTFYITIKGKGGHAAMPQLTVDSIAVGAQVVTNLQHIVSRNIDPIDPVVVSVSTFRAGSTHNVIPGSVEMIGTVRSFKPELRETVPQLMERVIKGVTMAHGADYEFKYVKGYRPVINHDAVLRVMEETVKELYGKAAIEYMTPTMTGEDFSAYQNKVPGAFIFIGVHNEEQKSVYPHHHERFTIDEGEMEKGVRLFVRAAFKFLNESSS